LKKWLRYCTEKTSNGKKCIWKKKMKGRFEGSGKRAKTKTKRELDKE
jgi:hypothetical protein